MDLIIDHFIESKNSENGYGLFQNEKTVNPGGKDVVDFSLSVSKSQLRRYKRYRIVPSSFISYLQHRGVLPEDLNLSRAERTVKGFGKLLNRLYPNGTNPHELKTFLNEQRERMLKDQFQNLQFMFGSGDKLEQDLWKMKNGLPIKENTKVKELRWVANR